MKVNKIDHISIAVRSIAQARKVWEPVLGKSMPDEEYIEEKEEINVARYWIGEVGFELMESRSPSGDVARFINKNGEGVMLISFHVDDTRESVRELTAMEYPVLGQVRTFKNSEYAFIHPQKMTNVLVEIIDGQWE
ncbi:MAG: VOC family protein [Thermodesulfobacteriota bacterium]